MANKTVVWTISGLVGETGLTLLLFTEGGNSIVNGAGDALTNSAYGRLTCTVTEALAGWYDAVIIDASSNIVTERGPDSKLYFPGDIAGTYVVGQSTTWAQYLADQQYFQPVVRSVDDVKAISFLWPLTGRSFTSSTKVIDQGSSSLITGSITEIGSVGTKYEYLIAYAEADRPTVEGTVRYTLTDGTNVRYLTLRVERASISTADLTAGATVLSAVAQTGELNPIIIGDDYLASIGRAFEFTITIPTGYVLATSTCKFGGKSTLNGVQGWLITGTITLVSGQWLLSFDMGKAISALLSGSYDWSVEVINATTMESTPVISHPTPVQTISKQT